MSLTIAQPRTTVGPLSPRRSTSAPSRRSGPAARRSRPGAPGVPTSPVVAPQRNRSLPEGTEARGFALYVGIDEAAAAAAGTTLAAVVEQLKALTAQLVPTAETYAAVAVAAEDSGGRDVDVVRLALQDRSAVAARKQAEKAEPEETGVVIDISRKRVTLDGEAAPLTYKEFELLQFLVLREGPHRRPLGDHRRPVVGRRGRDPERAHHRRARPPTPFEARGLRGDRPHRPRCRLPLRPARRRRRPLRLDTVARPVLTVGCPVRAASW